MANLEEVSILLIVHPARVFVFFGPDHLLGRPCHGEKNKCHSHKDDYEKFVGGIIASINMEEFKDGKHSGEYASRKSDNSHAPPGSE